MMVVVADTSPLNYLVQIDEANLLAKLYGAIVVPAEVFGELTHPGAPPVVNAWVRNPPHWLQIRSAINFPFGPDLSALGVGERAAIQLAQAETDALLLIDDADGRRHASRLGLAHIGTLGVLRLAAIERFIDLRAALHKLALSDFRVASSLIRRLIVDDEERRRETRSESP